MVDVVLLCMPYAEIRAQSAALGLLQAVLEKEGITATSIYANLVFAEKLGVPSYRYVAGTRSQDAFADWTFAHLAFPAYNASHKAYFDLIRQRSRLFRRMSRQKFEDLAFRIRDEAERFIDGLLSAILEEKPKIVGCTSTFCQHAASLAILKRIRDADPTIVTMLGGANCETVMGATTHKHFSWVDYVVSGEADALLGPLVRRIMDRSSGPETDSLPEGVFGPNHRNIGYPGSNENQKAVPRAVVSSLEDHPPPNYDPYFEILDSLPHLKQAVSPALLIETARGCWWGQLGGCRFCGLNGCSKGYRSKSPEHVMRDMESLSKRYGTNRMQAVENIMDMRYFKTVFPRLEAMEKPYQLFFETRSNLNHEQVRAMRHAGVIWIQPGIESLHSGALKLMNKGCQAWQNIRLLIACQQYGIRPVWNHLYNLPGEKEEWYFQVAELLPLLRHLPPPASVNPVRFDRYSHYHEQQDLYGLRLRPSQPYSYVYPLPEEELADLVYFFDDEKREKVAESTILSALLSRPAIDTIRKERSDWWDSYWSDSRSVLCMTIEGDALHIRDTRPVAVEPSFMLTGLEREVYLRSESGILQHRLLRALVEQGHSESEVEAAVSNLLQKQIVIDMDDRLLALAYRGPSFEMPLLRDFPGQYRDLEGE
jgi:ribosomal peptide maturation radical SAM protein 1